MLRRYKPRYVAGRLTRQFMPESAVVIQQIPVGCTGLPECLVDCTMSAAVLQRVENQEWFNLSRRDCDLCGVLLK